MDRQFILMAALRQEKTEALAQRIYDYTDPWNRELSVEEIAETIKTDPETVISYLMDIIEELTS